ncbi:tetratricopeptide repeat protein [Tenacibaculum xiamenense]|uniref:tetratricopeptide repeat protein n=1 Tax=Tenacibaculum xiamenense TaxID=1261553 RepID=UPI0038963B46
MMRITTVFMVLYFFTVNISAQKSKQVDSLLKLSEKYWTNNADSSYFYANKAIFIAKSLQDKNLLARTRLALASSKLTQGGYTFSENTLLLNVLDSTSLHDEILGDTYKFLGYTLYQKKKYSESSKVFLKGISIYEKIGDSVGIARLYNGLGMIQYKLKREVEAEKNYEKALDYNKSNKGYKDVCTYLSTQMSMADLSKNRNVAEKTYLESVVLAAESGADFFIPTIYRQLSDYYINQGNYANAISYAKKSFSESARMKLGGEECLVYKNIGAVYFLKEEYKKAIEYYFKALPSSRAEVRDTIYKQLSKSYYRLNDIKNGEHYFNEFLKHSDSIHRLQNEKTVADIVEKYNSDKKDMEIQLLQHENFNVSQENKRKKTQLIATLFLVTLLLFVSYVMWKFFKREKEQNNILYAKNQELVLLNKKTKETSSKKILFEQEANKELLLQLENVMNSNLFLDKKLTLSKLAKTLNTNTSYLSNLINNHYQKNFTDFINKHRITYVLSRLEIDEVFRNYTIEHISDSSGFNSTSAFYKAFKRHTGLTPSYYIKQRLKNQNSKV